MFKKQKIKRYKITTYLLPADKDETVFFENENILVTDLRVSTHGNNIYLKQISTCTSSSTSSTSLTMLKAFVLAAVGVYVAIELADVVGVGVAVVAILVALGMLSFSSDITITLNSGEKFSYEPRELIGDTNLADNLEAIINKALLRSHIKSE